MDKKFVLYAENNRAFLDARSEFLDMEGYQVVKAYSSEEAEAILENDNIHLVLLDIRLENDNDEGDTSGILLAKDQRFRRIPKIMITGFPTYENLQEVYGSLIGGEQIACAFLAKQEGPMAMIKAVNGAFEKVVGINWNLQIVGDEIGLLGFSHLALFIDPDLTSALLDPRRRELKDLVSKLFPADEQISLIHLNWQRDSMICLTLFALKKGASHEAVVILGNWQSVNDQFQLIGEYLEKEPGLFIKPGYAKSLHYAGLAYLLPDNGEGFLRTGPSFFHEAGEKAIRIALENLFTRTLKIWRQHEPVEIGSTDLAVVYRERLGILAHDRPLDEIHANLKILAERASSPYCSLVKEIFFEGQELKIVFSTGQIFQGPDPIEALFDPLAFNMEPATIALTFGGISTELLLLDPDGHVHLTYIPEITKCPILEDFISIECESRFDHIGSKNLLSLWDFEKQLDEAKTLNDQLPVASVEPDCKKAMAAIQTVRKLAVEASSDDLEPYLIGLFHYAIKPLVLYKPQILLAKFQITQLVHRLMAASMILDRTRKLHERNATSGIVPAGEDGLKIFKASRVVIVDNRNVILTPKEFKLLLYLYTNANQMCLKEAILTDVFDIKTQPTGSERGLLNTHIDRLRKKIDVNPAKHRYIVTIRGEGYLLDLKKK